MLILDFGQVASCQVTLPFGTVLAGWGKAKFREMSAEAPMKSESEILFEVTGDTLGILDNKTATVSELLTHAKSSKPNNAKICYHKCQQQPDSTWKLEKDTSGTH